jgi:hypothetical protein
MSDFWQELIISWGGNAILVGLIAYLGKIYLERIGREEQAAIDERLKRLEQDHEKLLTKNEHFHQISQQTYQKLFDKKVDTYNKLLNISMKFREHKDLVIPNIYANSGQGIAIAHGVILTKYGETYKEFTDLLDNNLSLVSAELVKKYFEWRKFFKNEYELIAPEIHTDRDRFLENLTTLQIELGDRFLEEGTKVAAQINKGEILAKGLVIDENFEVFEQVLEQIMSDVKKLNKIINNPSFS